MTTHLAPDRCTRYRAWSPPRRLLGIWSHPDDEAYVPAGLMDRGVLLQRNVGRQRYRVFEATDGIVGGS